ncbi:MAG: type II toxin-antitoxin system Phd/YefM family antitoxin [Magnetococcales bacterium]|nr:type II toxin-antitoxin system Phd/YefM family antitoxin [Magnetococcales bacterium]
MAINYVHILQPCLEVLVQDSIWPLNEAKNRFSTVVEAAQKGTPQTVTKHGVPAAVVISTQEYERLHRLQQMQLPAFSDHLLNMPTDDGAFDRAELDLRYVDL